MFKYPSMMDGGVRVGVSVVYGGVRVGRGGGHPSLRHPIVSTKRGATGFSMAVARCREFPIRIPAKLLSAINSHRYIISYEVNYYSVDKQEEYSSMYVHEMSSIKCMYSSKYHKYSYCNKYVQTRGVQG